MKDTRKKHTARQEQWHKLIQKSLKEIYSFENAGKDDVDKAIEGTKTRRKLPVFAYNKYVLEIQIQK